MTKCLLTYETIDEGNYSSTALKRLARGLTNIREIPLDTAGLRQEAAARADKMSIQGVQTKLSALLSVKDQEFKLVDREGRFILKPQSDRYAHLPENEDLTMHLAALVGIEVPAHGLVKARDGSLVYFIKRFDRSGQKDRIATEDFGQVLGLSRETKYESSLEKLVTVLDQHCTFPALERKKLFERTVFNYLVGNEDMHLKNFSLITQVNIIRLAPAYDFLNSSIVLRDPEELALPLKGKKRGVTRKLLVHYFAKERLRLNEKTIQIVLDSFEQMIPTWNDWIAKSFLPIELKMKYLELVKHRLGVLGLEQ
ncbi:MAG: HipA domain-containing protein [Oligoflexus sp.]|nr:HipA domain-containing protein [Oligoflexus sp.]